MPVRRISSGSTFEQLAGYCRAVVAGDWVLVSGTTGYDYATMSISDDVAEQTEQCFLNIHTALMKAGVTFNHVVRINIFIARQEDFETVAPIVGKWCRNAPPANTTVVSALTKPEMLVEIEVTAYRDPTEEK